MCLASCSFVSKDFDTSDKDNLIIQLITYVLDQAHYLDKEINDEFSEKVFDTFLENLIISMIFIWTFILLYEPHHILLCHL